MREIGIPSPGFGTAGNDEREECASCVAAALEFGYRHVDTAQAYDNEEFVGEGIERSSVERDDVFLATKVHPNNLGYDDVLSTTKRSLERLRVDYVDLLYVHWPIREYDAEETMNAFNELYDEGKIRNVGISNFTPELVEEALEVSDAPILANQIEMHPLLQQEDLVEIARENDMYIVAYSPLGQGEILDESELVEVAEKHGATPGQVSLAWLMSKENVVPIPMSKNEDHIRENYEARELGLDNEDIRKIDSIDRENRLIDPDYGPWNP